MKNKDIERWQAAKNKIIGVDRQRQQIGTLSEKTVHAVVKNYYEPNEDYQEIPIEGKCADIYTASGNIIEIQTRSWHLLKPKLDVFLPSYDVTLVLPLAEHKQIIWIDPDTGELCKPGPNRKYANPYYAFTELSPIRDYLDNPNLHIKLLMMDMIEYKLLSGRSKDRKKFGAERFDRVPTNLNSEISLDCKEDYMQFVPEALAEEFTSKDFTAAAKIPTRLTGYVLGILRKQGIISKIGTGKNGIYIYRINEL